MGFPVDILIYTLFKCTFYVSMVSIEGLINARVREVKGNSSEWEKFRDRRRKYRW